MKSINEALQWRYAVKKMTGEKVEDEKVQEIIEAARFAPTSSGLMPYNIILITNQELKEKIQPIAFNQTQIVDSSHLLVFASWDEFTAERIDNAFLYSNKERGLPDDFSADYVKNLKATYASFSKEKQQVAAAKQAYIGFGFALFAAAQLGVDTTPMEGFINEKLDELLGLEKLGLKSQTILAIGHRDEKNDWLFPLKKVRKPLQEFVIEMH